METNHQITNEDFGGAKENSLIEQLLFEQQQKYHDENKKEAMGDEEIEGNIIYLDKRRAEKEFKKEFFICSYGGTEFYGSEELRDDLNENKEKQKEYTEIIKKIKGEA